jgi:pimeloyl-ACP methyl ester carboxylesterase
VTFRSAEGESEYLSAYDAVLATWPILVEPRDAPTPHGSTRVNIAGPVDAPPLVLLAGGGATSTVWFNNVEALGRRQRLYAIDVMGDAGRSVPSRPLGSIDDLMAWLDAVLDCCGLDRVAIGGHSYGGWIALTYALRHPERVRALVLVDPTTAFAGWNPAYLAHALPLAFSATPATMRRLLRWETRGAALDPTWLHLVLTGVATFRSRIVFPKRPRPEQLRGLAVPTQLLAAQRSRAQHPGRLVARAERLVPGLTTEILAGASHHTLPTLHAADLNDRVLAFLDRAPS